MNQKQVAEILNAIAKGFSPITGDKIEPDNVLAEPEVIAALEFAVNVLLETPTAVVIVKKEVANLPKGVLPSTEQLWEISALFGSESIALSSASFANFLIGRMQNPKQTIENSSFYGILQGKWNKKELQTELKPFLDLRKETKLMEEPWKRITFFEDEIFNKLSPKALDQLTQRVNAIPLKIMENVNSKASVHARHGQPWTEEEKDLLLKSLPYVNDLNLLSACFGRSNWSIKAMGQQLLFAAQN